MSQNLILTLWCSDGFGDCFSALTSRTWWYINLHSLYHPPFFCILSMQSKQVHERANNFSCHSHYMIAQKTLGKSNFVELLPIMSHHSLPRRAGRCILCFEYIARCLTNDHQNSFTDSFWKANYPYITETKHYLLQRTAQWLLYTMTCPQGSIVHEQFLSTGPKGQKSLVICHTDFYISLLFEQTTSFRIIMLAGTQVYTLLSRGYFIYFIYSILFRSTVSFDHLHVVLGLFHV